GRERIWELTCRRQFASRPTLESELRQVPVEMDRAGDFEARSIVQGDKLDFVARCARIHQEDVAPHWLLFEALVRALVEHGEGGIAGVERHRQDAVADRERGRNVSALCETEAGSLFQ